MTHDLISTVSIPVGLIGAACSTHEHRLLNTWVLVAQVLDPQRTGRIRRRDAVQGLQALGMKRSAAFAAIASLCTSRYATLRPERKHKELFVVLTSISALHASYGVPAQRRDVEIPLDHLIGSRRLKRLFAMAAASGLTGPVARATRTDVLGVSPATQRRGEQDLGATIIPTYIEHDRAAMAEADDLPAIDRRRVFVSGNRLLERGANQILSPFNVVQRSRRRPSPSQATGESPVTRPQRQHFDSEHDLKRHGRRHGIRPKAGFAYTNSDDQRLFVRSTEGTRHQFGRRVLIYRVAHQPTAQRRVSAK